MGLVTDTTEPRAEQELHAWLIKQKMQISEGTTFLCAHKTFTCILFYTTIKNFSHSPLFDIFKVIR